MGKTVGFPIQMAQCFWCGEERGEILIGRRAVKNHDQLPRMAMVDYDPCETCSDIMGKGVLMVEASHRPIIDNQPMLGEAYPTGRWIVITEEAFDRIGIEESLAAKIKELGRTMVDPEVFVQLLPRDEE